MKAGRLSLASNEFILQPTAFNIVLLLSLNELVSSGQPKSSPKKQISVVSFPPAGGGGGGGSVRPKEDHSKISQLQFTSNGSIFSQKIPFSSRALIANLGPEFPDTVQVGHMFEKLNSLNFP